MDDTSPDIAERVREMFEMKSPVERLKMGCSMHETSKHLVARSIRENTPIYSGAAFRQELFLKFYGDDFDAATRQKILDHLGPAGAVSRENRSNFEHIPETEKEKEWWVRLYPLIRARLLREKPENSRLLKVLGNIHGFRTYRDVKNLIELALTDVEGGARILARTSEIKNSPDPDGIIDDMFAELRTIPYLLIKGFKNISYSRRESLDFRAEFEENIFHIESTYVHGPDFKTQEYMYTLKEPTSSIYKIRPDKLVRLFENIYEKKKEQVSRHHGTAHNSLIFMVSDLEETYAPWLEHAKIQGRHPLLHLVSSWEIPVVIFGCGSVYEPPVNALGGVFGKLKAFPSDTFF